MSSQSNRPIPAERKASKTYKDNSTYFWNVGTQREDANGDLYIDESIVKSDTYSATLQVYADKGVIVILEGETLAEYLAEGFVYITNQGISASSIRKAKEQESTIAEMAKKIAAFEAAQAKPSKVKGGPNA
jgi:osmotically-inducible protein OsmY